MRGCFLAVFGLLFRVKVICLLCLRLCLPESPECFAGWVAGFPREGIVEGVGSREGETSERPGTIETDARQHWRRIKQT